jgi:DNA repair protein RadC
VGEILLYSRRSVNPLEISESQRELALDEKASFSVMMSAEAFLKLTTSDNQHFDRIMREALSLGNYNQFSQEGKTLISPLLRINQSGRRGGHITGHEGRHRAAAILHNGETFFPVNIVLLDEVGYSSRKFSILDTPPFWYNQWFLDRPDDPHVEVKYLSAMDNIDSVLDANIQAQYQKNPKIPSGPLNHEEFLAVMKEIEHRVWVEWLDEMEAAKVVSKAPDQWHENPELPLPEKYKFLEVDTVLKRHPDWSPEKAAEFQFKDPEDIARFVSESMVNFGVLDREHFFVIPVDQRHRPTGLYDASIGTATETLVHSRDVLKPVILTNAAAVVFVHNHPTGYLSFSRPDLKLMERLNGVCKEMGIRLLDFMIIGHEGEFKSAVTEGFLVDTQMRFGTIS